MTKEDRNARKRDAEKAAVVNRTARIVGITPRSVRRVVDEGTQENELVLSTYMTILEEDKKLDDRLLKAVNELVPFE